MRGKPTGRAGWTVTLSYFERETPACTLGWRKLFDQGVETVDVPGDHLFARTTYPYSSAVEHGPEEKPNRDSSVIYGVVRFDEAGKDCEWPEFSILSASTIPISSLGQFSASFNAAR